METARSISASYGSYGHEALRAAPPFQYSPSHSSFLRDFASVSNHRCKGSADTFTSAELRDISPLQAEGNVPSYD